ncbi:signal recognition particle protein [Candidatus Legionella polyplacis]|uniref:signal-recognition-particle GTPase n=1 Tax=Candidatus Legionella polyplacis TaxID=2005262 RepID=A0ABZ2GYS2_9GAMM
MFENLTNKLSFIFDRFKRKKNISKDSIYWMLNKIRISFIELGVSIVVVNNFIQKIEQKILGEKVLFNENLFKFIKKVIYDELVFILGGKVCNELVLKSCNLNYNSIAILFLIGLQGSGKTTTSAKLALYLKEKMRKNVMLSSLDIYRPGAVEQLKILSEEVMVPFFSLDLLKNKYKPIDIAKKSLKEAERLNMDIVIFDTAGRLHVNSIMMKELKDLYDSICPSEVLFVIDSMVGQDSINIVKSFYNFIPFTGFILTKVDSDSQCGVAFSIKYVVDKPIKFIGNGESIYDFEFFYPDRIASNILGMGDIFGFFDEIQKKMDNNITHKQESTELFNRVSDERLLNLEDFKKYLLNLYKIENISNLINKLPSINLNLERIKNSFSKQEIKKYIAIIDSMTLIERNFPKIIVGSRKKRIAIGSGTKIQDVNRVLKEFDRVNKIIKDYKKVDNFKKLFFSLKKYKK